MADQVDYAALAEQARKDAGGIDYAALAAKARGTVVSPTLQPVSDSEPDTWWGGVRKSLLGQLTDAAGPVPTKEQMRDLPAVHALSPSAEKAVNSPLIHPTGIDAIDSFSSPAGIGMLLTGAVGGIAESPTARGAVGRGLQAIGKFDLTKPLQVVGKVGEGLERSADASHNAAITQDRYLPNISGVATTAGDARTSHIPYATPVETPATEVEIDRYLPNSGGLPASASTAQTSRVPYAASMETPPTPPQSAASSVPLSDLDLARQEVAAGRLPQGVLTALEKAAPQGKLITTPVGAPERPPITVSPDSPLQQPRVDIGAEVVGRQNSLTKQQVRQQTAPILGEQPGEASPVFPQKPFERMHDTLLGLPKDGPDRAAYVQSAGDPKTMAQLQTILRTLQRNGLSIGAVASMPALMRDSLLKQLSGSDQR